MFNTAEFQKVTPWRGLRLFVSDKQKFITAAVNHGMALNLKSPSQLANYLAGNYPSDWKIEAQINAIHATNKLRQEFWSSFIQVLIVALLACGIAYLVSLLGTSLPVSWSKVMSTLGGFLAGWGTLFALGSPLETHDGETLPELVHPKIFITLFIPGLLLSFLGQLW